MKGGRVGRGEGIMVGGGESVVVRGEGGGGEGILVGGGEGQTKAPNARTRRNEAAQKFESEGFCNRYAV